MTEFGTEASDDPDLGGPGPLPRSSGLPDLPLVAGGGFPPLPASDKHRCADTPALVLRALEGVPDPSLIDTVRALLASCPPCAGTLEVEIRFKIVMSQRATDRAPRSLQLRISETLQRVDLGEIDVTDL